MISSSNATQFASWLASSWRKYYRSALPPRQQFRPPVILSRRRFCCGTAVIASVVAAIFPASDRREDISRGRSGGGLLINVANIPGYSIAHSWSIIAALEEHYQDINSTRPIINPGRSSTSLAPGTDDPMARMGVTRTSTPLRRMIRQTPARVWCPSCKARSRFEAQIGINPVTVSQLASTAIKHLAIVWSRERSDLQVTVEYT